MEEFKITSKQEKEAEAMMDSHQSALSTKREEHINNLGTNVEGDHLYYLRGGPASFSGEVLAGRLYGHEIKIWMGISTQQFVDVGDNIDPSVKLYGSVDGKKITSEQARKLYDKWHPKAMDQEYEDEDISRAIETRIKEAKDFKWETDLNKIIG